MKFKIGHTVNLRHGHCRHGGESLVYLTWQGMMGRCFVKSNGNYCKYGAKGITVCERWKIFENFLADMGERPGNLQIDRIDNNKGYSPENCRWTTSKVNNNNKRAYRTSNKHEAFITQ